MTVPGENVFIIKLKENKISYKIHWQTFFYINYYCCSYTIHELHTCTIHRNNIVYYTCTFKFIEKIHILLKVQKMHLSIHLAPVCDCLCSPTVEML